MRLDNRSWPDLKDGERAVLREVLVHGSRSRVELARRLGLSRPSLSRLTRALLGHGLVYEGETLPSTGRGRPSEIIHIAPGAAHFAGVKLTGAHMYLVVTDLSASIVHAEERALEQRSVEAVVDLIGAAVAAVEADYPIVAVGVCLAGDIETVDGRELVVHSDFLGWELVSLLALVESATGHPAAVDNDVQTLTMAHHWFGAGVGLASFALLVVGAGIGSGIVVNGELLRGAHGRPGKLDHMPIADTGPQCDRGHVGCLSAYATTLAISCNAGLGDAGYSEALRLARSGDEVSLRAFRDAGAALGAAVASVSNLLDPDKVIITGEGLAIFDLAADEFAGGLRAHANPQATPPVVDVQSFSFQDYAWAAAIGAIRRVV